MPQSQDSLNQDSGVSGFRIARLQAVSANSLTETGTDCRNKDRDSRVGILRSVSRLFQTVFSEVLSLIDFEGFLRIFEDVSRGFFFHSEYQDSFREDH